MKRVVLFVEGEGDADAAFLLVKRLLGEMKAWEVLFLDKDAFRVGSIGKLVKEECREWKRKLGASLKRGDVGGVLLLLDGDAERIADAPFCAASIAVSLASHAVAVGAGRLFSVAVVFALKEYESWLIAGIHSLTGRHLPDGRLIAPLGATAPEGDLENRPRDAKGWLNKVVEGGYKPTRDQAELTRLLDLQTVRDRNLRSFRRFESALSELVFAIRHDRHVSSPAVKAPT